MKHSALAALAAFLVGFAPAVSAVPVYGQCGGIGYTGSTVCDAGSTCTYSNDWYSQCLPGAGPTTTSRPPTSTTTAGPTNPTNSLCSGTRTKFKYFGVNQSSAEFGNLNIPGTLGKDYTWPTRASVDFFVAKGLTTHRIAFLMERLSPPARGLTGAFDATYLAALKDIANYVTSKGGYAVLDPHNFMRYNGAVITSTSEQTWWKNLANEFKSNSNIIFDIVNEPHDMTATAAFNLNQAAVNGIRSSGATSQLILVEGTSWTGAWTWVSSGNADAFKNLKDPNNNVAFEMHQYLDSDGSGTNPVCVSSTIGAERLAAATAWLKQNNFKGFLGEIGAGSNDACIKAVQGAFCSMQQSGVWIGALWWAAGPWWGDYYQSIEPPSSPAIARILPEAILPFL
ncbi:glycoside hydrolase family 5 protein [Botryobasidium botryosum FD-172 SS1]|uniref:cellulase n=1 Tax=Botryobasidium botryosum (strain FD-172 SS1) TaxID=930990 RepID=A0A067M3Q0_BOTB1|nr:glycoside hydrolase family 5 protein [Botryobasidium botryosum FD-172 SS1]